KGETITWTNEHATDASAFQRSRHRRSAHEARPRRFLARSGPRALEPPVWRRGPGADADTVSQSPAGDAHGFGADRGRELPAGGILARYPLVQSTALPETRRQGRPA